MTCHVLYYRRRSAVGAFVLLLALFALFPAAPAVGQDTTLAHSEPTVTPLTDEVVAAVLPATVSGMKRGAIDVTTGPFPSSPRPPAALRPLMRFLPEALMGMEAEIDSLSGTRVRYDGESRPLYVGIIDYGSVPEALNAAYRQLVDEGHATQVRYQTDAGERTGYEGTGSSDDVVPPHGVKVLVGERFEVVVYERPPEGVTSIADFKALPSEDLEQMIGRARSLALALAFDELVVLAGED